MTSYEDDIFAALTTPSEEGDQPVDQLLLHQERRIHASLAPTNQKMPYTVYEEITTESETAFDGPSGVDHPLVQFTTYSKNRNEARNLRKLIRTILEGNLLPGPHGVVATFSNQYFLYDKETKSFGALVEFRLHLNPQ